MDADGSQPVRNWLRETEGSGKGRRENGGADGGGQVGVVIRRECSSRMVSYVGGW